MRNDFIALVILFAITSILIAGCLSNASDENTLSSTTLSEMALQLSDLPEGYEIQERSERVASDVRQEGLDQGWKRGYVVNYQKINVNTDSSCTIQQVISVYPIETITPLLLDDRARFLGYANDNFTVDEMPNPTIGDTSLAFRSTEGEDDTKTYYILFAKKDVYEDVRMTGTVTDYELLKDLAKKAAAKIK